MAAGDGLISMTPTSIAYSGTSASINVDGGVDFSAVTSLSLNGVFTSDYDNYLIVVEGVQASGANNLVLRLRASGTDAAVGNYDNKRIFANGSGVTAQRDTNQNSFFAIQQSDNLRTGGSIHVYGPALAQPTAFRSVNANGYLDAYLSDTAGTHSLSTAYDGFTVLISTSSVTGTLHVFGYEE